MSEASASSLTRQQARETALASSCDREECFRLLAEHIDQVFWFMELHPPRVTYVSPAFEQIWGVKAEALYADHTLWAQAIHPEDRDGVSVAFDDWVKGKSQEFRVEYRITNAAGEARWVADRGIVTGMQDGRPDRLGGVVRDITDRKRVEMALRVSEAEYRCTFENAAVGIAHLNLEGRWLNVNDRLCAILDHTREEILAQKVCLMPSRMRGGDGAHDAECELLLAGQIGRIKSETMFQRKDGSPVWVTVTLSVLRDHGMVPLQFIAVIEDITRRKQAEQVIRTLNAELESRVEQRTAELSAAIAALRLQIAERMRLEGEIISISELEQQRIGQDLHDDLGQQLAGAWCLAVVLEHSLKAAGSPEAPSATAVAELLQKSVGMTRSLARGLHPVVAESEGIMAALRDLAARAVEMFKVDCRFQCRRTIAIADNNSATHLYRIAQECVTNAVKHGRARHIIIRLVADHRRLILRVQDDGSGFQPPAPDWQGMGLRIMRYRANIIGGTLDIRRSRDGGTLVTCIVPKSDEKTSSVEDHVESQI